MLPFDKHSDEELVHQCNTAGRDDAISAFEALYARHKDYVLRVAMRYLHDTDLALDVLQETFSYLLREFPPPGNGLKLSAHLRTLLYAIARNQSISILRKNSHIDSSTTFDPDIFAAPQVDPHEVTPLLAGLSRNQREVIELRFIDDLSLADMAEALEVPVGTVKSRLHGAIKVLRRSRLVKKFFEK